MSKCAVCGNNYEQALKISYQGKTFHFDSFECAIHKLAPICQNCGCRIIGHGVENENQIFCCENCARQ